MWTPRRLLLLLVAGAAFAGIFYGYNTTLGGIDGLPQLPDRFLRPADTNGPAPEPNSVTPTEVQLGRAFGPASDEARDTQAYKFKLYTAERGLVFAGGQPEFGREASRFVRVSPFSIGFFADGGKKVRHPPGEVEEVSTIHGDECVMQFDRDVGGLQDMQKAKLVGLEVVSRPDRPTADPRRGRIWVTNNQKSPDPNDRLLFRTPGPLFYQAPDADPQKPAAADAPQVWTAAFTEVIDGRNLPRPLPPGTDALPLVPGDALRGRGVVADMIAGGSLPPPTMTAQGMKIFLRRQTGPAAGDKRNSSGYSGVRLIELMDRVQINLWADGGGGVPGGSAPAPKPPGGLAAPLAGGLADAAGVARKLLDKTLLVIETPGSFRYDFEASRARFDVPSEVAPGRSSHVTVARIGPTGRTDDLVCRQLLVDFFGGPDKSGGTVPKGQGMAVKALTATGEHVFLSVDAEGFSAQGQSLVYRNDPAARTTVTTLRGGPVEVEKDRNRLQAGSADAPAEVALTAVEPPPPKPGQKPGEKSSLIEVRGPGRMHLWDAASNATTLTATWKERLVQQKDTVGAQVQDLLRFEGGAEFRDTKSDFRLTADDKILLWLAPDPKAERKPGGGTAALPQRLLAVRNVRSESPELEVGMATQPPVDQLTVWFRDGAAPAGAVAGGPKVEPLVKLPAAVPPPAPTAPPPPATVTPAPAAVAKQPEPPPARKPPIVLSARAVESWVLRYPLPPPANGPKKGEPTLKYEMERARLDDRVVVHQDPADPTKVPRGLDITGQTLNLTQSRAGSVMVVTGTPLAKAEVYFETTTIIGPKVTIDQPANMVAVEGGGLLRMPSQSDLGGGDRPLDKPTELEVTWSREMHFEGSNALAWFVGAVKAVQTPDRGSFRPKAAAVPAPRTALSVRPLPPAAPADDPLWSRTAVFCHQLDVGFDRPVYFSQMRRKDGEKRDGAKLRRAVCTPRPDDEVGTAPGQDRTVVYLEETLDRATRKLTKAQRIECRELDLTTDDARREQRVIASGEGEVRILQPGSRGEGLAAPVADRRAAAGPAAGEEMKLTWVKFSTRMEGRDQAKLFQSAVFPDGARVWQVPTDDLNLLIDPVAPPAGSTYLTCEDKLEVTSQRSAPGAPADQRMTATGAAEAYSDDYRGAAPTIRFARDTVIFDGTSSRPASFVKRQVGVGNQSYSRAEQFIYKPSNKALDVKGGTTGSIAPGNR